MTLWGKSDFTGGALGTNVSIETEPAFSVVTGNVQYVAAPEAPSGCGGQPAVNAAARLSVNPVPGGKTKYRIGFKAQLVARTVVTTYYPIFILRNNTTILAEVGYRGVAQGTSASTRHLGLRLNASATPTNERPNVIANGEVWSFEVLVNGTSITVFAWPGSSTKGIPAYTWQQTLASGPNNFGLGPSGSTGVRAIISDYWATDGERYALPPWTFPSDAGYEPYAEYDDGGEGMAVGTVFAVHAACRLTALRWWCPGTSGVQAVPQLWDASTSTYVKLAEGEPEQVGFGWVELPIGPVDLAPGVDYVASVYQQYTQVYTAEPVTLPIDVGPAYVASDVSSGIGRFAYVNDLDFPAPKGQSSSWFGVDVVLIAADTAPPIPTGNATTTNNWSASGVGSTMRTGFGSTTVNWLAAGAGRVSREGIATPTTVNWSTLAEGKVHRHGIGSVGVLWSADAEGHTSRQGDAATETLWSVSGVGLTPALEQPQGQAVTEVLWSTLALGSTQREGHAVTGLGWAVSAYGVSFRRGWAEVETLWTTEAVGQTEPVGSAVVEVAWDVEAVGSMEPLGVAVTEISWSAEGVGKKGFVIFRDIDYSVSGPVGNALRVDMLPERTLNICGPDGRAITIGGPTA